MMTIHNMDCRMAMSMLMDADSVDSIVTDPPYGLSKEPDMAEVLRHWLAGDDYTHTSNGFMGKSWDSFVPGPSVWREAYRVLKPGGYLVAFFGTRTYDLGVLALRLAGFEIRDQLAWVFGSGFPKSLDVSKAIDKAGGTNVAWFGAWLKAERTRRGMAQKELAAYFPSKTGNLTGCVANWELGLNLPTIEQFNLLCDVLGADFERLNEGQRAVIEQIKGSLLAVAPGQGQDRSARTLDVTAPATDAARQWQGWGTALKPAYEPIVLARKPLAERTVAANVLAHGTGAINIDGCRVAASGRPHIVSRSESSKNAFGDGLNGSRSEGTTDQGRWPANLCHDGSDEVLAGFPDTKSGKMLAGTVRAAQDEPGSVVYGTYGGCATTADTLGDSGSAARFFYCAKASRSDRNEGCDQIPAANNMRVEHSRASEDEKFSSVGGNNHPTVKPTDLMRWLVRLVTPPGGTVFDPFTGSGSTGKAAALEGFPFVGCELDPNYAAIAEARILTALSAPVTPVT